MLYLQPHLLNLSKKGFKMKKINYLDIIVSPNVTEKSTSMSDFNKVVFKVNKKANKKFIKKSI